MYICSSLCNTYTHMYAATLWRETLVGKRWQIW